MNTNQVSLESLRIRAEARMLASQANGSLLDPETDALRLVHELQVHQIELEMQNDALQASYDVTLDALHQMSALKEQLEGLLLRTADSHVVRKGAEEESRLHAAILENKPSGVLLVRESDQIIVYANPTLAQIVGYEPDELIGQHLACLSQPGVKKLLPIGHNRAWTGEQSVLAKDGNEIWCDVKLAKFSHANFGKVWIAVYTDISLGLMLEREIAIQKPMQLEVNAQLQRMESLLKSSMVELGQSGQDNDRSLTRRQQEILGFVAEGLTSAQISTKLNISSATVMAHRRDIMRKLDLHSTAALTRYAIQGKASHC